MWYQMAVMPPSAYEELSFLGDREHSNSEFYHIDLLCVLSKMRIATIGKQKCCATLTSPNKILILLMY